MCLLIPAAFKAKLVAQVGYVGRGEVGKPICFPFPYHFGKCGFVAEFLVIFIPS